MKILLNENDQNLLNTTSKIHSYKLRFSFFQSKQFVRSFVIIWLDGFHVPEKNAFPDFKRTNGSWYKKSNNHNFWMEKSLWTGNVIWLSFFNELSRFMTHFNISKNLIIWSFSSYGCLIRNTSLYVLLKWT